jgi:hypothetical protein
MLWGHAQAIAGGRLSAGSEGPAGNRHYVERFEAFDNVQHPAAQGQQKDYGACAELIKSGRHGLVLSLSKHG